MSIPLTKCKISSSCVGPELSIAHLDRYFGKHSLRLCCTPTSSKLARVHIQLPRQIMWCKHHNYSLSNLIGSANIPAVSMSTWWKSPDPFLCNCAIISSRRIRGWCTRLHTYILSVFEWCTSFLHNRTVVVVRILSLVGSVVAWLCLCVDYMTKWMHCKYFWLCDMHSE